MKFAPCDDAEPLIWSCGLLQFKFPVAFAEAVGAAVFDETTDVALEVQPFAGLATTKM